MHFFSTCASKLIADFDAYLPQKSSSIIFMTSFQHWSFRQQIFIWTWMNLTGLYEITKFWTNSGCPWNPDLISKKWKMFLYNNASLEKTNSKQARASSWTATSSSATYQQLQANFKRSCFETYNNNQSAFPKHSNLSAKMYIHFSFENVQNSIAINDVFQSSVWT